MNKVKVCVRCRPMLPREVSKKHISLSDDKVVIRMNDVKEYGFDEVFNEEATQNFIFDQSVRSLVEGCFEGYNATVFACK